MTEEEKTDKSLRLLLAAKLLEDLEAAADKLGHEVVLGAVCAMADFWREHAMKDSEFGPRHTQLNDRINETAGDVLSGMVEVFHTPDVGESWKNEN